MSCAVDCPEAWFGTAPAQLVIPRHLTLNTRKPVLEYVPVFGGISGGLAALHVHVRRDLVLATCACVRRSPCEVWEVRSCSGKSGSNTHVSLPSGTASEPSAAACSQRRVLCKSNVVIPVTKSTLHE